MTKRRTRNAQRELTRAELIALERRSLAHAPKSAEMPASDAYLDEPMETGSGTRGVMPPRVTRVAMAGGTLSRAQEMAYIRSDLRRLTILSGLMLAILAVLAVVLR